MNNYVAPEIHACAEQIVRDALGARAKVTRIDWSAGGLFNKVYSIHTTQGEYILKIECHGIVCSLRKEQMENEVLGSRLFREAGIPCADVLSHDFTGSVVGVRYVLTQRISNDLLLLERDSLDEGRQEEIRSQATRLFERMAAITGDGFGGLSPDSIVGRHDSWEDFYRAAFCLLLEDSCRLGLFTEEELAIVRAAAKPPVLRHSYPPSFVHGDLGSHNAIWGSVAGGSEQLYVFDFGNAAYRIPYEDEYHVRKSGDFGFPKSDITEARNLDRAAYNNLLNDFENMWWVESQRRTEDYDHCLDWMTAAIEAAKQDSSRKHIIGFVEKCRQSLAN